MPFFDKSVKLARSFPIKSTVFSNNHVRRTPLQTTQRWKSKKNPADESNPDGTFMADDMELSILPVEKLQKKPDQSSVKFGKCFTDYMFSIRWEADGGWGTPKLQPISKFRIHPASQCLHYGVELFEGMQAYRGYDGNVRLFRPDLNMKRLLKGARRLCLPTFDPEQLIECIKRLVKLEDEWIPDAEGSSLYIRPVYIATDPSLGITATKSAKLYVILCPVGEPSDKPLSLYADPKYVKSWPGGLGDIKVGGNYGLQIYLQRIAEKKKCDQILWLQGSRQELKDIGNMNIFFVIKNEAGEKELVTPPLTGLILNGVVRQSIIELCQQWKKFDFVERSLTIDEFKALLLEKRLKEVFGSGSSTITTPVGSVLYDGNKYEIPTINQDKPIYARLKKALNEIQYGKIDHEWGVRIDE